MEVRQLKRGTYIVLNEKPYLIKEIQSVVVSSHSGTKTKLELEGVFDGDRRTTTLSPHENMETVEIIRRLGQIISKSEGGLQVMGMDSYDTFDAEIAKELLETLAEGDEVTYVEFRGAKRVVERRETQ